MLHKFGLKIWTYVFGQKVYEKIHTKIGHKLKGVSKWINM